MRIVRILYVNCQAVSIEHLLDELAITGTGIFERWAS
jgi:hypothetical protein